MLRSGLLKHTLVLALACVAAPRLLAQDALARHAFAAVVGADERRLAVADLPSGPELCLGQWHYWITMRHDPETGHYEQTFVSAPFDTITYTYIRDLAVADVLGDSALEVVIGTSDDQVRIFDYATKQQVGQFAWPGFVQFSRPFDVLGDGKAEILLISYGVLYVCDATGTPYWSFSDVPITSVEVAQVDDDPALEIVAKEGVVIDSGTHALQWDGTAVIDGGDFALGDIDGDGREELVVAESLHSIRAFDVETQSLKWTIVVGNDSVSLLALADVQGDARPELFCGATHFGANLRIYDMATLAQTGMLSNSDPGVDSVAVRDFDSDGVKEIVWSTGATLGSTRHLQVSSAADLSLEWQSVHLDGPFIGPEIGDLDGDGEQEIVCLSNRGHQSGRIVVLDQPGLRPKAYSQPVGQGHNYGSTHALALHDVDGDMLPEILVGTERPGGASAEIYRFTAPSTFDLIWTNATLPYGAGVSSMAVADLENDGSVEVVVGMIALSTGFDGSYLYVYDFVTGAEEWHAEIPAGPHYSTATSRLFIDDVDGDGQLEIVVLRDFETVEVLNPVTHAVEATFPGLVGSLDIARMGTAPQSRRVLITGNWYGDIETHWFDGSTFTSSSAPAVLTSKITGLTWHPRRVLYLAEDRRLVRCSGLSPVWSTARYGDPFGTQVVPLSPDGQHFVTCGPYAVLGF